MKTLTGLQERVLGIIRGHVADTGQSPTVREIARRIGVQSSCTVQRHLQALERKGFIERPKAYAYRGWQLTPLADPLPTYAELRDRVDRLEIENAELRTELDRIRRSE